MNLQPRKETIIVQDEFLLNTQGVMFKVGGITLDGAAFGDGVVKAGTAVMEDDASGLFVPYAETTPGTFEPGANVMFTAQDAVIKSGSNNVVGAVLKGYLNTSKLTGVTDALRGELTSRYIFG